MKNSFLKMYRVIKKKITKLQNLLKQFIQYFRL